MTLEQAIIIKEALEKELELRKNTMKAAKEKYNEAGRIADREENSEEALSHEEAMYRIYNDVKVDFYKLEKALGSFVNADWHF